MISDASTHGQVLLPDIPRVEETQRRLNELLHDAARRLRPRPMKGSRARPNNEPSEPDEPESVARAILGEEPELSAADVAARDRPEPRGGAPAVAGARLPRAAARSAPTTDADVAALSTLVAGVNSGLIDFDLAVTLTRAVGQTMARLADWEVAALVPRVEELEPDERPAPAWRPRCGPAATSSASRSRSC